MPARTLLTNISSRGGLITYEFLLGLRNERVENDDLEPRSFRGLDGDFPPSKRELDEQILESWNDLLERWDSVSQRYLGMDTSTARTKWILPLIEALGFEPSYNKQAVSVGEKLSFQLSHRGWNDPGAPMVNCCAPAQKLEEPIVNSATRGHSKSPHDELQAYLNVTKACNWGVVTNGISLRILRQFYHTTTKGYVDFDIENVFRERSFSDFRVLYRLAHISRFMIDQEGSCILERFYEESRVAGVRIGEDLRKNVKKAIESLGNGFLTPQLSKEMVSNEQLCKSYYSELLRVVYRIIFLLFAEQRGMLPTRNSIYAEEYSINKLREVAEEMTGEDDHLDLWEGLKITFNILKHGFPDLKVFAYNGTLFDETEISALSQLTCKNSDLLFAVRQLTVVEQEHVSNRINYLDLGVEEIGSIYESLLEYTPRIATAIEEVEGDTIHPNAFFLDPRGTTRKSTGSYYTDRRLIDELIKSALKPIVEDRLAKSPDAEHELLSIKVCDPACGSGAFLIAGNNFLARELAKVRTREAEPPEKELRRAKRDILQHCIYGVDLNPMAVELTKVSLWINASVDDLPLNFLDHHIKCGNSIVGASPEVIKAGVPDEAFEPVANDDKEISKRIIRVNKTSRGVMRLDEFSAQIEVEVASRFETLTESEELGVDAVEAKKKSYNQLITSAEYREQKTLADAWVGAFFWTLTKDSPLPPSTAVVESIARGRTNAVDQATLDEIRRLSSEYRFFHYYLEFPDVFGPARKGFDCLLGNPPWGKVRLEEKEFFETRSPEIAGAATSSIRRELIEKLPKTNKALWEDYLHGLRSSELESKFLQSSGRYPLTAKGDIDTYAIFAEHAQNSISDTGLLGIIVPTGIATHETYKDFFSTMIDANKLVSLFDFENREGLFRAVHRSEKFSLLTMGNTKGEVKVSFAFFLHNPDQISEEDRKFELTRQDFMLLNPNTRTCPIFRTRRDAEITKSVYRRHPILIDEKNGKNPWHVKFTSMFHMSADSSLFKVKDYLQENGFTLDGNTFFKDNTRFLPLYEGKMLQLFDHRAASVFVNPDNIKRQALPEETTEVQHRDASFVPLPRYWVDSREIQGRIPEECYEDWFFGIKDVTSSTNLRTFIGGAIPFVAAGHNLPLILFDGSTASEGRALLVANMSSRIFDFIAKQKVGGLHLSFYIVNQLPIIPPDLYSAEVSKRVSDAILELVYTSHDIVAFARSVGYDGDPFEWSDERREELIAKLDATYALLYALSKDDFEYVLDSFASEKRQEIEKLGEFRSKRLALEFFDEYSKDTKIESGAVP